MISELDILIKCTDESFVIVGRDMRVLLFNDVFAQRYKLLFDKTVAKGDHILQYILPGRKHIVTQIYEQVFNGETIENELQFNDVEGNEKYYINRYKPFYDDNGDIVGAFITTSDITLSKQAGKAIADSEKRFRLLIENSEDIIVLMDSNREVSYVSPSFIKILGYSPEEVIGKRPLQFTHPDDFQSTLALSTKALQMPGQKLNYTMRVVKKSGEYIYVDGSIINLLHVDGVNALVNNFIDITERKQAREQLQASELRYRTLFELSPTPMFIYDDHTFEFVEINKAALDFYGYTNDEMRKLNVITMRPEFDRESTRKNIEDKRDTDFYYLQTVHEKKDGTVVDVQVYNNKIQLDGKELRLIQIIDITQLVQLEKEREQTNQELRRLNEQIQNRAEQLENANKELRNIAWMQSHLVRSPVSRILGLTDVLFEENKDSAHQELIKMIKDSSVELDTIIRQIVVKIDNIEEKGEA